MKKLTVFTPTYNRAYCLHQCYESLKRQTSKDFIWLIIDDGSTDDTKKLVDSWVQENVFEIRYHWQENQGMHGAHNTAYQIMDTELNVCIDSDDYMTDDAVEKIICFWNKYGNDRVSGIIALDAYPNGQIIGTKLPDNLKTSTLYDLYNKHGVSGDKKLVYRTQLTKQFPYPIYENEKFVGLAYKYYMLDQHYDLLIMNEVLCYVEYLPDGSTKNILKQYVRNPRGYAFYRRELMKIPYASLLFKFRHAIHYVSSSIMSRNTKFLQETPCKILTTIAIPFGVALFFYVVAKTSNRVQQGVG